MDGCDWWMNNPDEDVQPYIVSEPVRFDYEA